MQTARTDRWVQVYDDDLSISSNPERIAMGDHDGDAPTARLVDGPVRREGAIVPMVVMTLPPYHQQYSSGKAVIGFGDNESNSESMSDTVSLTLSADVGTSPDFFGLFGTKFSARVDHTVTNTISRDRSYLIGSRYTLSAEPEIYGPNYGGVVIGWGCFDAFLYEIDDPRGRLGGDGEKVVITVPTGGGQALYNTGRYNAMAEALGGLPTVDIPYTVGDPRSYPSRPERLGGRKIQEETLLFPEPRSYTVSDVGAVGWWNSVGESVTNTSATNTSLGATVGITAFGVSVGGGISQGWGSSYGLTVGTSALIYGSLPPLPDDLSTPEDEHARNRYTVTPWTYQESWKDDDGNEAKYWVVTYEVDE